MSVNSSLPFILALSMSTHLAVAQGTPAPEESEGESESESEGERESEGENEGESEGESEGEGELGLLPPRVATVPPVPWPAETERREPLEVRVELTIEADGSLRNVRLLEDPPAPFGAAALGYATTLAFVPATRGGEPIAAVVSYLITFAPPIVVPVEIVPPEVPREEPAEEAPDAVDEEDDEFTATAELEAISERPPASASEQVFELEMLRDVPRTNAEQMLTMAGVVLANHAGEGHASSMFLRGFDAGEGQDMEVLVDGIPMNEPSNAHLHGYADTGFLIPELVESVRVLAGPYDPAQGDFALAGTAEYRLGLSERGLQVLGGYGSFHRRRALVLYGDGERSFAGLEIQSGSGFGINRAHRNVRALARYGGGSGNLEWSLTAASHALRFDSAGVVREDAIEAGDLPCGPSYREQLYCTPDPNQGGAASRHLLAFDVVGSRPGARIRQKAWVQLRRDRFRENFTGFLLDERGDGLDERTDGANFGLRTDVTFQGTFRERELTLDLGLLARHDRIDTRIWRLRRADEVPYRVVSDDELALTTTGAYLTAGFRSARVALRGGARLAAFALSSEDNARPTSDRMGERLPSQASDAFGVAVLPRATLVVTLVKRADDPGSTGLDWVSSIGRGARSSDAAALSEGENAPFATSRSMETGFRLQHGNPRDALGVDAQTGVFWTNVDRDLLFNPEAGRNTPVGETQRFGAFVNGRARLTGWLEAVGTFTWSEAHLPGPNAGPFELTDGPRLPFVPRFVGRVDFALRHDVRLFGQPFTLGAAVGGGVLGRRPLPLNELGERIATLDVSARVRWRYVEVAFLARNLTDNQYRQTEFHYESVFDADDPTASLRAARHIAAGSPRELFVTLTLHLDTDLLRAGDAS